MKLCLLSDVHGHLPKIEKNDLTIIAGDVCPDMINYAHSQLNWIDDSLVPWLESIPAPNIVLIWRNHDFVGEQLAGLIHLPANVTILCNNSCELGGVKLWGTPYSKSPPRWAFVASETMLDHMMYNMPPDTDIIVSHGPPSGVLDLTIHGEHLGSESLRYAIQSVSPKLVVCGHIHEARGVSMLKGAVIHNVSLAQVDWQKQPHSPVYINYPSMVDYGFSN